MPLAPCVQENFFSKWLYWVFLPALFVGLPTVAFLFGCGVIRAWRMHLGDTEVVMQQLKSPTTSRNRYTRRSPACLPRAGIYLSHVVCFAARPQVTRGLKPARNARACSARNARACSARQLECPALVTRPFLLAGRRAKGRDPAQDALRADDEQADLVSRREAAPAPS